MNGAREIAFLRILGAPALCAMLVGCGGADPSVEETGGGQTTARVSPVVEGDSVIVHAVSLRKELLSARLNVQVVDVLGTRLSRYTDQVTLPSATPERVWAAPMAELLAGADRREVVLEAVLTVVGGSVVARSRLYFVPAAEMRLPRADILADVLGDKDGVWVLAFTSAVLARDVRVSVDGLEGRLSRDRFDLLPGEIFTLTFTTDEPLDEAELLERLRITSMEGVLSEGR